MTNSREQILASLRSAKRPFPEIKRPEVYHTMIPRSLNETSLKQQFIQEAGKLGCSVYSVQNDEAALAQLLQLIQSDKLVSSWMAECIPIAKLLETLNEAGIAISAPGDATVRLGITGVNAALAATGSLVLSSGKGRFRSTSLLPPVHIAVVSQSQILPDLESWFEHQRKTKLKNLRKASNIVIISGPSRTADINMELIMGMHGPRELHIILIEEK